MSGSGGFYKYRCKYFLSYNCDHWVYVNGTACAYCLAAGRDPDAPMIAHPAQRLLSQEICVPRPCDGTLEYLFMELVESGDGKNNYWAVRYKVTNQQILMPTSMVTTDTPRPVLMATSGPPHMMHAGPMGY